MEKATAEMLIARKLQGEYDKLRIKKVELAKLDMFLELKKPDLRRVLDLMNEAQEDDSLIGNVRFNQALIYEACPALHNKKLQETFDCAEPPDIVMAVLDEDMSELNRLAEEVLGFYGLEELSDKVKN